MPSRREFLGTLAASPLVPAAVPQVRDTPLRHQAERLVVVSLDGVRVQEMFSGFDRDLFQAMLERHPVEAHPLHRAYWAPTAVERRVKLMPFLWGELLTRHGSIVGNREKGSVMQLGNRHRFSYPGYAELMLGVAHDDEVTSNENRRYPHETVLQFLRRSLGVARERVALFGSWEVFESIAASRDDDVFTNAGLTRYDVSDELRVLGDTLTQTPPSWNSARFDYLTFRFGMAHMARHRPVVQWFAFNDTDEWSHAGNYPRLVEHLHRLDVWMRELWSWLQAQDDYRGRTALVCVTDHGRGLTRADWSSHGAQVEGAQDVWAAFAVPTWTARGEQTGHAPLSQSQVAATLAAILGFDWRRASPGAGAPWAPGGQV